MHTVAVVAVDEVIAFDLSTPIEVFGWARDAGGQPAYRVMVCGEVSAAGPMTLVPEHGLDALQSADTIVVPGSRSPERLQSPQILAALRAAHREGKRMASICVGAFTVAQAGLLDGRVATTHWEAAALFRALYPDVDLTPESMFREQDGIHTSAGAAAGLDLCLELIRRDHGGRVAADAARHAVMPLHRDGGQAPFIDSHVDTAGADMHELTAWLSGRIDQPISLGEIAAHASVSIRTLNRRFQEQLGCSPMAWVMDARVKHAKDLLAASSAPVESVAYAAGFGSPTNFRTQFKRAVGVSPQAYRRSFRGE